MDLIELKALEEVNELRFTESEREVILNNFSEMEKKEEALKSVDTTGVESTVFVRPLYNVLREDKRVQPFSREDLLKGAPQSTEDSWQVPRLVKQL